MSRSQKTPRRRTLLKGTLAVAAAPAIITSAQAQPKISWKVQTIWPKASSSFVASTGVLADELEKRTDGRFRLELLAAGEIAKGVEVFNVVRRGVVQMGATTPAYNIDEASLMGLYGGVPGTLREPWELMHLTKNLGLEAELNKELEPKGVFMMADKVLPAELILKKKIEPDTNLRSIKVSSSGNPLRFLGMAGFAAQHIDGPELYQSLATGVIDGAQWGGAQGGLSMKLWEVAKIHMMPPLAITHNVYVINLKAYQALPEDLQLIFTALVEERYAHRSLEYQHLEAIALNTGITKMGVEVGEYPPQVRERMKAASLELLDTEMAKSPQAQAIGEKLRGLMTDLGYI